MKASNLATAALPVKPAYIIALLVVVAVAVIYYWGGRGARQTVKTQDSTIKDMGRDAQTRAETATGMASDQSNTVEWASNAQGKIHERIIERPVAVPVAASSDAADADILRIAREAHARATCARERVRGKDAGDSDSCAP